ncbi:SusC/RagA family TonB-linked outer membrane protein [Formosa sp. 4Alg 33]|uniref:SusC/RagA family TonB-linked outer membrane protein n=1 Tax=Formosa sp. 4Alg 33 TaxID=3382189 RepID=UPI003D9C5D5B
MNFNILQLKCHKDLSKCIFILGFLICNLSFAQQKDIIQGVINDAGSNMPLPGVNIIEKNTSNGTTTDFDGNYSLSVAADATLVISYIGYKTQEVSVSGQSILNLGLVADLEELNEIVLVGYGTQKKKDLTGSVGTMDASAITERNVTDPMEAIQGNVAGVVVSNSSGRVGDGFDISIRGTNSFSGNTSPLYVVDGVITEGIDFLNPNDIQSIDILKDASSTAIYGSRGSNGVVLVTTKNGAGARGKVTVSYDTFYGIKNVARLPDMMDTAEWIDYHKHAYLATTDGGDPMNISPERLDEVVFGTQNTLLKERYLNNETFDWYDAVLKTGTQSNNYLSIAGRADNGLGYNIGIGVQTETGNIPNESLDKYTFKSSINHKINDKFSAGANVTVALSDIERGSQYAMQEAFRLAPAMTPYDLEGNLFPQPGKLVDKNGDYLINKTSTYNPLMEISGSTDATKRWNMLGSVYGEYRPLEWLSFKTTFSAGYDSWRRGKAWSAETNTGISNNDLPSAQLENRSNFNYTWDNQMNINHTFNENHTFNFLALQSIYSTETEGSTSSSRNMPFDTDFYNIGSGQQSTFGLGSYYYRQQLASFALRINYSFMDRYLITLSNRWDGSSKFAEGNKWDSFPSAAFAWRLSEESFMENVDFVSDFKFRVSYGFTGNDGIDPYSTLNILDQQQYYELGGNTANGWLPSSLSNSNIVWEKTREFNFGIDYGFFNQRVFGSIDLYDRLSDDLLVKQDLPLESGWEETSANIGSVSNKGVEVGLTTVNVNTDKIRWTTTFTFAKNTNKLEELYGDGSDDIGNNRFIGKDLTSIYNFKFNGIWQANERDLAATYGQSEGQAKVVDVNNDGKITAEDDRVILGHTAPDWTGGFNTTLNVGQFDLSASVVTSQGSFVYSEFHANFTDTRDRGRQKLAGLDYYVPENTAGLESNFTNAYPQGRNQGTYWRDNGVGNYRDASYVKVKNISFGYKFDDTLLEKLKLSYLRVYANVLDPFVFTDYDGYDPEWAGASLAVGRVGSVTYQLGLSIKF